MENDILKLISRSTVHGLNDITHAYHILNKSFDKLLVALNGAICLNNDIITFAMNMEKVINTKVKLTFWQKLKKCWKILWE